MTMGEHYPNAPLIEALLDIRAELPEDVSLESLAAVGEAEREGYPTKRERTRFEQEMIGRGSSIVSTAARNLPLGYRFDSADGQQLFHAQVDGFTFNRLKPYPHWELFRAEARRVWESYCSFAHPVRVTRLALRYINRFDLPAHAQFEDYLNTLPAVAPPISQSWGRFLMRVEIPQPDIDAELVLTEAMVEPQIPNTGAIVLDIDLFRSVDLAPDSESMWDAFETLRERKNEIFEACITDKVREGIR